MLWGSGSQSFIPHFSGLLLFLYTTSQLVISPSNTTERVSSAGGRQSSEQPSPPSESLPSQVNLNLSFTKDSWL